MARRRRSKFKGERKAISQEAHTIAIVSGFSVLIFILSIASAVITAGETANYIGALSTFAFIAAIISLGFGAKVFKSRGYTTRSRVVAVFCPLVAVILWAAMYGVGLLITG